MDKRFLDKVVDQIVSETIVDYENERVYTPTSFTPYPFYTFTQSTTSHTTYPSFLAVSSSSFSLFLVFSDHCKDVYGLNKREILYVWEKYVGIIIYKKNG